MLQRATDLLYRHATGRSLVAALAASVVGGVIPLSYVASRIRGSAPGAEVLDMVPGYSPDEAYAMIARYGVECRSLYVANACTFDTVGPALFALTLALILAMLLDRLLAPGSRWRALAVLLPLAGLLPDLVENVLLSLVVSRFPERADAVARAASFFTLTKRAAIFSTWGFVAVAGLALLARRLRPRPA